MSFLKRLGEQARTEKKLQATARPTPISLPEAQGGLAGSFRDPYRINAPLEATVAPTNRRVLEQNPPLRYRG